MKICKKLTKNLSFVFKYLREGLKTRASRTTGAKGIHFFCKQWQALDNEFHIERISNS